MEAFHWRNIHRGFQGFEDLALEYVAMKHSSPGNWTHTPYTRDGNRDACSIICGFRPNDLSPEEWWMEAKYSTHGERLTRYRLDSTIVSAAIHGNVSKIIFVTNISISTKTIVDIRAALKQAIHCREVYFCGKTTLEYWLFKNPEVFQRYFPNTDIKTLSLNPLFLSEGIEFFSNQKIGLSVSEPLKFLHLNREYYLFFSVFSQSSLTLPLSVGEGFSGVKILSSSSLSLAAGITPCVVKLSIGLDYSMPYRLTDGRTYSRSNQLDGAILKLGPLELVSKTPLEVLPAVADRLFLPSQEQNFKKLKDAYESAGKRLTPSVNFLIGSSGTGKTYLMDRFVQECLDLDQTVFRVTFSSHSITNDLNIYYMLVFCLYPYLPPDMVDETYLKKLQDSNLENTVIYQAAAYLREPDRLHQFFISTMCEEIFPNNLHLNPRVILLDDLHKLEHDSLSFLLAAISELAKKQQPIYVLVNGWPEITESAGYRLAKRRIFLQELSCSLTPSDLAAAISKAGIWGFDFDPGLCPIIFPSVIELLAFVKHLHGTVLHSLEDFLIESRLFLSSDIAQENVLARFQKLFEVDSAAENLCKHIYWSINGVPIQAPMTETERKLIRLGLVKTDDSNTRLIPYHDQYSLIFRRRFELTSVSPSNGEPDVYINTIRLISACDPKSISQAIEQLQKWKEEGRFYAMLYVLEGVFETSKKDFLRGEIGDRAYFALYRCYAFGVTNGSHTKSGCSVFEKIIEETKFISDPEVLSIRLESIFELINSRYEWLRHDEAYEYINELKDLVAALQNMQQLPRDPYKCEKYVLTRQVEMLISSEHEEPQTEELFRELDGITEAYHFDYEREFFKLRYAESMYYRDTARAFAMATESQDRLLTLCGPDEKFYLWAKMDCEYLKLILKRPNADFNAMRDAHLALRKNFFNDYRKRLFAVVNIYYVNGLISSGDKILFSDNTTPRDMRPRQAAFYAETMALRYALQGKRKLANMELEKAAELFAQFPSYLAVIYHNQQILTDGLFQKGRVRFCTENICPEGDYCIDPRCIW